MTFQGSGVVVLPYRCFNYCCFTLAELSSLYNDIWIDLHAWDYMLVQMDGCRDRSFPFFPSQFLPALPSRDLIVSYEGMLGRVDRSILHVKEFCSWSGLGTLIKFLVSSDFPPSSCSLLCLFVFFSFFLAFVGFHKSSLFFFLWMRFVVDDRSALLQVTLAFLLRIGYS